MAEKSDFLDFLMNSLPMSFEMFNYLVWWDKDKCYVNLGMSPLYKEFIDDPFSLETVIGEHCFIAETEYPVFLCPASIKECDTYSTGSEQLQLKALGQVKSITYHLGMKKEIEPFFKMKIEDGVLFNKKDGQWIKAT